MKFKVRDEAQMEETKDCVGNFMEKVKGLFGILLSTHSLVCIGLGVL